MNDQLGLTSQVNKSSRLVWAYLLATMSVTTVPRAKIYYNDTFRKSMDSVAPRKILGVARSGKKSAYRAGLKMGSENSGSSNQQSIKTQRNLYFSPQEDSAGWPKYTG
jgi:hypothetical protein